MAARTVPRSRSCSRRYTTLSTVFVVTTLFVARPQLLCLVGEASENLEELDWHTVESVRAGP